MECKWIIDECFLDMTGYLMNSSIVDKAKEINRRVTRKI